MSEPTMDVTMASGQGSRDWRHSLQSTRGLKCAQMVRPEQQTHHRLPLPQAPLPQGGGAWVQQQLHHLLAQAQKLTHHIQCPLGSPVTVMCLRTQSILSPQQHAARHDGCINHAVTHPKDPPAVPGFE